MVMIPSVRKILLHIWLLSAAGLPLAAQDKTSAGGAPKPGRSAWFACTSLPPGFKNPTKVLAGETVTEIEIPRYMASAPVKIPKDGMLRLVAEDPDPANPGKMQRRILAQAMVARGVREALLILVPLSAPKNGLLFNVQVQDLAAFQGGDRLYINLSKEYVRIQLGKDRVTLAPKHSDIYQATSLTKPTNIPVLYEFYHPAKNEWRMISASTVVLRPTRREINVFNSGSRPGNIKKHKILFPLPNPPR